MRELQVLISFGGFIALLLWGVHMVQTGVQRAFGKSIGLWMGRALGSPTRAFATGLLVTAAIQSSTATGLMITGFAMDGLVSLTHGLAAMLGANVGTTLIVQVLSFNPTFLAPGAILLGVWMFYHYPPGRKRDTGRIFIGLGLLLLSLHELVNMFEPLKSAPIMSSALDSLRDLPVLALAVSTALTWASHSSVAVVILIMSLAHHDLVSMDLAYVLVLGANLGTAINPVLEGGHDGNPASRRLPIGNLGTRFIGCMVAMALLPWADNIIRILGTDQAHAIANFHLLFNLIVALCFMPALKPYSRLLDWLLPQRADLDDPAKPMYLDESAREVPAVALGQASREALRLTDLLDKSLQLATRALLNDDEAAIARARYYNGIIAQLDQSITAYLATMDQEGLSAEDAATLKGVLTFSIGITHAAGVVSSSLLGHAGILQSKHWTLRPDQQAELKEVLQRLQRNLRQTAALLVSGDRLAARSLAFEKDHFRALENKAAERHLDRIKSGQLEAVDLGAFYLEILRDIGSVNAHLVNAVAYPILDRYGDLRPNRLRDVD